MIAWSKTKHDKFKELVDLRNYERDFPMARAMKRKIIYHGGPTNSGKTYSAVQSMIQSSSGIYVGPLRLLAQQVFDDLNYKYSIPCDLSTGQELIQIDGARHLAATVEKANLNKVFHCGIIDEIQMMSDPERGESWTAAVYGLPVRTLHVCGSSDCAHLVKEICEKTGDDFEYRKYRRFSPLQMEGEIVNQAQELRPYDCIIAFSRAHLLRLRQIIEATTDHKCAIIYGALPPSTRRRQVELFNDPNSGVDILVATNAIGMGLNFRIARVLFFRAERYSPRAHGMTNLEKTEILQMAGRAGRGAGAPGFVSTIHNDTFMQISNAVSSLELPPQKDAVMYLSESKVEEYLTQYPDEQLLDFMQRVSLSAICPKGFKPKEIVDKGEIRWLRFLDKKELSAFEKFQISRSPIQNNVFFEHSYISDLYFISITTFARKEIVELNYQLLERTANDLNAKDSVLLFIANHRAIIHEKYSVFRKNLDEEEREKWNRKIESNDGIRYVLEELKIPLEDMPKATAGYEKACAFFTWYLYLGNKFGTTLFAESKFILEEELPRYENMIADVLSLPIPAENKHFQQPTGSFDIL